MGAGNQKTPRPHCHTYDYGEKRGEKLCKLLTLFVDTEKNRKYENTVKHSENKEKRPKTHGFESFFVVRVTGLEPAAS